MLGQNLRQLRLKRRLTQQELAQLAGIGQTYISELERNKRSNPSIDVLESLAMGLNVNIEALFENDRQQKTSNLEQFDSINSNDPPYELIKLWLNLTANDKDMLLKTAQSLHAQNKIS